MKNLRKSWRSLAVAATVVAMTGAAHTQSWEEVAAAADEEGKVAFLHNIPGNGIEAIVQDFNKEFPNIEIEQIRLSSSAVNERFDTEFTAGRNLWDAVFTVSDGRVDEGMEAGWAATWTPPEISAFDPAYNLDNQRFVAQVSREVIAWNKNLVSDADAPKQWADLLDPRFKGRVGMTPPWRSVTTPQTVGLIVDVIGIKDYAQRMKDNGVQFLEGTGGVQQALLRGDIIVAATTDTFNPLLADGAPIGFVYSEPTTLYSQHIFFLPSRAPRPNAGKVFLNWLLSETGQISLQAYGGLISSRTNAPPPSHLPGNAEIPKLSPAATIISDERRLEIISEWRTLFGIQ